MAFVSTPVPKIRSSQARSSKSSLRRPARMAATSPSTPSQPSSREKGASSPAHMPTSPSGPRPRASAPVVDSRVASAIEAHHWITVQSHGRRLFERAAVAQADMTRQVERRAGKGALHRWVLRQVSDPMAALVDSSFEAKDARYVVMETFKARVSRETPGVMRRWLSAVEKVGPLMDTVDIRTRNYENVFTSKLHDVKFDPNTNIVVMESINVDMSRRENVKEVLSILRSMAEASVSAGTCLEFCVLHAPGKSGFFKTIEVYRDVDALHAHMDTIDRAFTRRVQGRTTGGTRSRQTFRPVVYS